MQIWKVFAWGNEFSLMRESNWLARQKQQKAYLNSGSIIVPSKMLLYLNATVAAKSIEVNPLLTKKIEIAVLTAASCHYQTNLWHVRMNNTMQYICFMCSKVQLISYFFTSDLNCLSQRRDGRQGSKLGPLGARTKATSSERPIDSQTVSGHFWKGFREEFGGG